QWEHLKRPMQLQEKNPIRMKVYYLDEHHKVEEQQRLQQSLGSLPFERIDHKTEIEMERDIHRYRTMLTSSFYQRRKKVKNIFSFGKPFMLYILMVIKMYNINGFPKEKMFMLYILITIKMYNINGFPKEKMFMKPF